uniref:Uncharacterized protein n=1 Tax=Sphaerodactylus townsendi TaxID=933632 RepID=A0ACB8FY00_9SAUR
MSSYTLNNSTLHRILKVCAFLTASGRPCHNRGTTIVLVPSVRKELLPFCMMEWMEETDGLPGRCKEADLGKGGFSEASLTAHYLCLYLCIIGAKLVVRKAVHSPCFNLPTLVQKAQGSIAKSFVHPPKTSLTFSSSCHQADTF